MACPEYKNMFGYTKYDGKCKFFEEESTVLPPGVGWGVVAGLGSIFSIATSVLVWLDFKFGGTLNTSEHFNTAGRSIKAGLTACDIVSKWTWAATILQSSNVAFKYGVSGPFWYASGATIQILLFAVLAIEVKRKAPTAHTVLEIVLIRWGRAAHFIFLVFCLLTNVIVTAMLILGGSAVVSALTGINVYAGAFLIPVGVMLYIAHGGLKASILAAWTHVAVVYSCLCLFMFYVYGGGSKDLGSISKVYDHLKLQSAKYPISGNLNGSSLTMLSRSGVIFGLINIVGNFGTVFVDQAYWQSAIAAKPSATYRGYLLGGIAWFAIPFSMATSLGLAARALDLPITMHESDQGLVPPAVATHLLGKAGAFLLVLQLFMAVTASGAAEQMAVSSLVTYDVYRTYFNPQATGREIILVSRICICIYGVISGGLAIILLKLGLELGWVYLFMGVVIGSAVFPIAFSITWNKCSGLGAVAGAILGQLGGLIAWLVTAESMYGEITLKTTGKDYPMLAGNLVSILLSGAICIGLSLWRPQNFDWKLLQAIAMLEHDPQAVLALEGDESPAALARALTWTYRTGSIVTLILILVWPVLALPVGEFSKGYFYLWVIVSITWGAVGAVVCIVLPLYESAETIFYIGQNILACHAAETPPSVDPNSPPNAFPAPVYPAAVYVSEVLKDTSALGPPMNGTNGTTNGHSLYGGGAANGNFIPPPSRTPPGGNTPLSASPANSYTYAVPPPAPAPPAAGPRAGAPPPGYGTGVPPPGAGGRIAPPRNSYAFVPDLPTPKGDE